MQAVLITAYKDFDYLDYLIKSLRDDEIYLFIHIDQRTFNKDRFIKYENDEHVKVISTRKITWGSIHHLNAILDLMKIAVETSIAFNYFHCITGQDYMYKNLETFKNFFCNNKTNYMSCSISDNTTSFRFKKFYRNDLINYKSKIGNLITKGGYIIQKLFLINRNSPMIFYKGMVYVSITFEFADYILSFIQTKEGEYFLKYLKWCFIPEEFFFQTLIMNSKFKNTLCKNNLRFILWEEKHGTQPALLDIYDKERIESTDSFFIRKVNFNYSKELIDYFNKKEGKNEL